MSKYRYINHNGMAYFSISISLDGILHNPNGYPEAEVRAAVAAADARVHERRSNATKKAAITRARRQRQRIGQAAHRVATNQGISNRTDCYVCGRALSDSESMKRGIGPECWQDVLRKIESIKQETGDAA